MMANNILNDLLLNVTSGVRAGEYRMSVFFRALLIVPLLVCSFLNRWMNVNWFTIAVILFYILVTLKVNYKFILRYISTFSGAVLVWSAIVVIEFSGLWLSELQTDGYYCGILPLCASFYIVYLLFLEVYDSRYARRMTRKTLQFSFHGVNITRMISRVSTYGVIALTAVLFMRIANKPAFRMLYDRFEYREIFLPGIWGALTNYIMYLLPLILVDWKNGNRLEAACAIGLYVVYLFWTGERFTGFLGIMFYVSMFLVDCGKTLKMDKKKKNRLSFKQIMLLCMVLLLILVIVIRQYSRLYEVNSWVHLMERITQQGQLWWAIYAGYRDTGLHLSELKDELQVFTDPEGMPKNYGIYRIMYLCAPKDVVTAKIEKGQNYTESTGATIYYYFGPAVLILFAVFFGIVLAYLMRLYFNCIMENRIVSAAIVSRLLTVYRNFVSMSRFHMLFGKGTLFLIFIYIILRLWRKTQKSDVQIHLL